MADDWMTDDHKAAALEGFRSNPVAQAYAQRVAEDERQARLAAAMVAWVREQIAEAESVARACAGTPWVDDVPGMVHVDPAAIRENRALRHLGYVASTDNSPAGDVYRKHIVRHDPRAVLAQCSAYTAILDEHASREVSSMESSTFGQTYTVCRRCTAGWMRQIVYPCPTVKAVALVYQHCPGFREEWR